MNFMQELLKQQQSHVTEEHDDEGDEGNFVDKLEKWMDTNRLYHFEGRRGVIALAKLARVLGYKDPGSYGQLDSDASIGDIIEFLEDNSGAIEAIFEWVKDNPNSHWEDSLRNSEDE